MSCIDRRRRGMIKDPLGLPLNMPRKIQPAVMELVFPSTVIPAAEGGTTGTATDYIDLSQVASIVNRRFYRQGLNWMVSGIKLLSQPSFVGSCATSKLGTTWSTGGAWEKTMRNWLEQQNDALEQAGAIETRAAYRDYKIHMDDGHVTAGFAGNLLPQNVGGSYIAGEWQPSQVVMPNVAAPGDTQEYVIKMYGSSDATAKSILGGYSFSRAKPFSPDPNTPAVHTSWLSEMHDVGDIQDEVVQNAVDKNDEMPYNGTLYPGQGANGPGPFIHDISNISATTLGGQTRIKGGSFPCGLIKFEWTNETALSQNVIIQIDLIPGTHRGYMCEKMEDF